MRCYLLSSVWLFATPWSLHGQAPLSMKFSRQEYWSGVPSPSLARPLRSLNYWQGWEGRSYLPENLTELVWPGHRDFKGFHYGSDCKEPACSAGDPGSIWVGKIPWSWEWLLTPIFLPGEFHRQRSLAGYSPWGHKESNIIEWLTLHFTDYTHLSVWFNEF